MKAVLPGDRSDYSIPDNSKAFHEFLEKEGVQFKCNEVFTDILPRDEYPFEVDIFALGRKYERYIQENHE